MSGRYDATTYRDIFRVSWSFARVATRKLVESESPVWMYFNEIPMAEKMANHFTANRSYAEPVDICAVFRLKILAIYHWSYRGFGLVEDDGVDAEVASGDEWTNGIICNGNGNTATVNTVVSRIRCPHISPGPDFDQGTGSGSLPMINWSP